MTNADLGPLDVIATDWPTMAPGQTGVRNSVGGYDPRTVVPLDLTGAAGTMGFQYDHTTGLVNVVPLVPILLSGGATALNNILVADGAYFRDVAGLVIISLAADPTPSDGSDGQYAFNTTTGYVFGPKAAGVWPATGVPLFRAAPAQLEKLCGSAALDSGATIGVGTTHKIRQGASGANNIGTWTLGSNGYEVPSDGVYDVELLLPGNNQNVTAGNSARVITNLYVDNALAASGPKQNIQYYPSAASASGSGAGVTFVSRRLALTAGQEVELRCTGAQFALSVFNDWGWFNITRVG